MIVAQSNVNVSQSMTLSHAHLIQQLKRDHWFGVVDDITTVSVCPNGYCNFSEMKLLLVDFFYLPSKMINVMSIQQDRHVKNVIQAILYHMIQLTVSALMTVIMGI